MIRLRRCTVLPALRKRGSQCACFCAAEKPGKRQKKRADGCQRTGTGFLFCYIRCRGASVPLQGFLPTACGKQGKAARRYSQEAAVPLKDEIKSYDNAYYAFAELLKKPEELERLDDLL